MIKFKTPLTFQDRYEQRLLKVAPTVLWMIALIEVWFGYYSSAVACSLVGFGISLISLYDRQKFQRKPRDITAELIEVQAREMCAIRGLDPDEWLKQDVSTFGPDISHTLSPKDNRLTVQRRWRMFYYPAFDMLTAAGIMTD